MKRQAATASAPWVGARPIVLNADGTMLSGMVGEPVSAAPRATIVALHGIGMSAGYFHGPAHPDVSLLTLAARMGYTVLALDRPGYGLSADRLSDGQSLSDQADAVLAAVADFASEYDLGAGVFLLGHSFGGQLALTIAASQPAANIIGIDVSGCGYRYAASESVPFLGRGQWIRHWGSGRFYPPGTFTASAELIGPTPQLELREIVLWAESFATLAPRIRVPVRFTFAEFESWWRHDEQDVDQLRSLLVAAPRVSVTQVLRAGHNISLGWAARTYHLQALAFFESCLLERNVG